MQRFQISPGRVTAANGRMHWRPTPRQVVPNQKLHPGPRGWSVAWNDPHRTDCNPLQSFAIRFDSDSNRVRIRSDSGGHSLSHWIMSDHRWPSTQFSNKETRQKLTDGDEVPNFPLSNKRDPSAKLGLYACISSRITTVIQVVIDHRVDYNCFNEPFAVSPYKSLY